MFGRIVGVMGLALVLSGAEPASAKDEFEDGFKDELGRIAAHEAVRGGRQILASILLGGPSGPPPAAYQPEPAYYEPQAYAPPVVYVPAPVPVVYYERHDVYHHYPVAYGYREPRGWPPGHSKHWKHSHGRGCDD